MRVGHSAGADFAQECRRRNAYPVRAASIGMFANSIASKRHLQVFVERELDRDVRQPQQRWGQARIERADPLAFVHFASRIPRAVVLPGSSVALTACPEALRHESCFDHPDRIRRQC